VLDWYTVTVGIFALCVLAMHGALFLRIKLEGEVQARAARAANILWLVTFAFGVLSTIATQVVQPRLFQSFAERPFIWALVAIVVLAFFGIPLAIKRFGEGAPFLFSCVFIAMMLAATAAGVYPTLLNSTLNPAYSLNIENASTGALGLHVGIYWWVIAIVIAIGYFVYLFRTFGGKVDMESEYGH
jgi:cytochrome d ubiquinol oxidase subunit II